ncbi:hypothetical protein N9Z64_00600 [bacterium]|nr:hypothetical protein [bacterium]
MTRQMHGNPEVRFTYPAPALSRLQRLMLLPADQQGDLLRTSHKLHTEKSRITGCLATQDGKGNHANDLTKTQKICSGNLET